MALVLGSVVGEPPIGVVLGRGDHVPRVAIGDADRIPERSQVATRDIEGGDEDTIRRSVERIIEVCEDPAGRRGIGVHGKDRSQQAIEVPGNRNEHRLLHVATLPSVHPVGRVRADRGRRPDRTLRTAGPPRPQTAETSGSMGFDRGYGWTMSILKVPFFMGERMPGFAVPLPHDLVAPELPDGPPQVRMAVLYDELATEVESRTNPVVYCGDCVVIIGVLGGLQRRGSDPTLVFMDAHGDFNTWETSPSGFIGGMPLAMVTGRGEQTILEGVGTKPLPDHRVILVDGRDLDAGEDEAIAASGIVHTSVADMTAHVPDEGPIYVHIDTDIVDPSEMPAMNYPAPGGPGVRAVREAVASLAATDRVVAFSISAWNPTLPDADVAASATFEIATPMLEQFAAT
jgi:arginase